MGVLNNSGRPFLINTIIVLFISTLCILVFQLIIFEIFRDIEVLQTQIFTSLTVSAFIALVFYFYSDKNKAKKQYIENFNKMKAIVSSSPNSLVLVDINGIIIECNPSASTLIGKSNEELVGSRYFQFLPLETAQKCQANIEEVILSSKSFSCVISVNGFVYRQYLTPILDGLGSVKWIAIYNVDITELMNNQESLKNQHELSESVRKALELFISGKNSNTVYQELLKLLVTCSGSEYGFLDEVLYDENGKPYKLSLAMSDISWDKDSKELYNKLVARKLEFRNLDNLAGLPVLQGRTIIANDVENHPNYKGIPVGHPTLKKYMGIPLYFGQNLIGVAAVANSESDYTNELAEFISPLVKTCSVMIWANRLLNSDNEYLKTIEKSEEKYRQIVTTAQEGVWIIDNQANTTFVNDCLCQMLGYSENEMMGRSLFDFMDDSAKIEAVKYFKKREEGISEKHDFRFKRKDGTDLWVMLATNALSNENGEFVGALGMLMDITERKIYELQIEQSQLEISMHKERLEALLYLSQLKDTSAENILDYALNIALSITQSKFGYIYHYDESKEQFTLFSWSNQAMNECNIREKQTIYELDKTGIWGEAVRQRKPIIINDFNAPNELKKGYPDGHVKLKSFLTVPVFSNNIIVAVIGVANKEFDYDEFDVNQLILLGENVWSICLRKNDEEKINNYAKQMKELNTSKDKFFSIIAHDLRNPIGNFKELSKILIEEYDDLTEEEKISFLKVMQESSAKLYTLMENLLEWSRSQRGLIDTNMERFDLYFIVHECKEVLSLSALNKNIKIINNVDFGTYVFGNSNLIKTVVRNLISNAIKFSYSDQSIEIGIDKELSLKEENKICIFIKDSGIGIKQENISKIFKIDEHITTFGTSGESGTGLGLVLCKEFIEKHNCRIWAKSALGSGSTFYFTLPIINK